LVHPYDGLTNHSLPIPIFYGCFHENALPAWVPFDCASMQHRSAKGISYFCGNCMRWTNHCHNMCSFKKSKAYIFFDRLRNEADFKKMVVEHVYNEQVELNE
jgi:hypothetical protein